MIEVTTDDFKDQVWFILESFRPTDKHEYRAIYKLGKLAGLDVYEKINCSKMHQIDLLDLYEEGLDCDHMLDIFRQERENCCEAW